MKHNYPYVAFIDAARSEKEISDLLSIKRVN